MLNVAALFWTFHEQLLRLLEKICIGKRIWDIVRAKMTWNSEKIYEIKSYTKISVETYHCNLECSQSKNKPNPASDTNVILNFEFYFKFSFLYTNQNFENLKKNHKTFQSSKLHKPNTFIFILENFFPKLRLLECACRILR